MPGGAEKLPRVSVQVECGQNQRKFACIVALPLFSVTVGEPELSEKEAAPLITVQFTKRKPTFALAETEIPTPG
jgi:hypothetical protein